MSGNSGLERGHGRHGTRVEAASTGQEQGTRRHEAAGFGRHEAQSTRTITGTGRAELGAEVVGEAGLRWKDGLREQSESESESQSAQGLRDEVCRLRGEKRTAAVRGCCRYWHAASRSFMNSRTWTRLTMRRFSVRARGGFGEPVEPLNRIRPA